MMVERLFEALVLSEALKHADVKLTLDTEADALADADPDTRN